jgi:retron-type reverse transcriptase
MRRKSDLWEQVTTFENLYSATYAVLRGKRSQQCAGEFFLNFEHSLLRLQHDLRTHEYRPSGYRTFWITDPKPRLISAASFRDRVVHHALVQVIEPLFEIRFIHHSYACRKGKGTQRALQQFVTWARSSRYVLKMDIKKFFPSLDHAVLKERIRRVIKDPHVLGLCDVIIDRSNLQEPIVQHFPDDDLFAPLMRRHGLPIGNLTSQFFANVYLDALDHFVKERLRVRRYLRYVDDFCCFADDKVFLVEMRHVIREFLFGLRVRLNEEKSRIRQVKEGIEFLGFVVLPARLRLNPTALQRQRKRLRRLQHGYADGTIRWPKVMASLQAWNAHAAHGTTWRLRTEVFQRAAFVVDRFSLYP